MTVGRGNLAEWDMVNRSSRIRNQKQRVDNICRAIFTLMQMRWNHFSQRRSTAACVCACVCVQNPGASIFQLINFIFTHLFLNVLSDGNAAGCSSEVLTWQMGLKGEVSRCQRQDFTFKLEGSSHFDYSWKARNIHAKLTWCLTALLIQRKSLIWSVLWGNSLRLFVTGCKCLQTVF